MLADWDTKAAKDLDGKMPSEILLLEKESRQLFKVALADLKARDISLMFPFDWHLSPEVSGMFSETTKIIPVPDVPWSPGLFFWGTFAMMRLLDAGEKEFRLSQNLATSLLLTEVKGVPTSDLQFPFPSFLLRLPGGLIHLYDSDNGWHECRAITVSQWLTPDGVRAMSAHCMGASNQASAGVYDARDSFFNLFLRESQSLEDVLDSIVAVNTSYRDLHKGGVVVRAATEEGSDDAFRMLVRFIMNALLYITLPGADVHLRGESQLEKLREQARKHPKGSFKHKRSLVKLHDAEKETRIHDVGGSILIPGQLVEAAQRERTGAGRAFTASWLVRGHWRDQAHGAARSERRSIWIQPYVKRRDLGEMLSRPYDVK